MRKIIKITAIIAFVLEVLYALFGRFLIPVISGIIYSNRVLSYSSEPVKMLLIAIGVYMVVAIIGLVIPLIYLGFMFALIAASKSAKAGIGLEICGITVMGLVLPVLSRIAGIVGTPLIANLVLRWGSADAYGIYSTMNSSGAFLSVFGTVALVLIIVSFTVSLCRKKWARDDEFEKGIEE
ncbi:MAG: hypothetical protein J6X80_08235 [Lachnospiraceae bacterium]|nr:hypothetical protein [Lachnospiraceae bacterium]